MSSIFVPPDPLGVKKWGDMTPQLLWVRRPWFDHRFYSLLKRPDAHIAIVCWSDIVIKSESRSRIEYLILTNNIMVLNSHFKLTNKFYLIDRL